MLKTENGQKKIILAAALFALVFLLDINTHKVYEARTDILLVAKDEKIGRDFDQLAGNLEQILSSLAFYDRIVDQSDALAQGLELPNYKRKEFWNEKLSVRRVGESGVVSLRNFDSDSLDVRELNDVTVQNLIEVIGRYYDISTDLELRVVDGPIVRKMLARNLPKTIAMDFLWTLLFWGGLLILPRVFLKKTAQKEFGGDSSWKKEVQLKKETPPQVDFPVFEGVDYFSRPQSKEKPVEQQEDKRDSFEQKIAANPVVSFGKKASTPDNLPVSDDGVPDIFRKFAQPTEEAENPKSEEVSDYASREATAEEVKERLNKLLGGGK